MLRRVLVVFLYAIIYRVTSENAIATDTAINRLISKLIYKKIIAKYIVSRFVNLFET